PVVHRLPPARTTLSRGRHVLQVATAPASQDPARRRMQHFAEYADRNLTIGRLELHRVLFARWRLIRLVGLDLYAKEIRQSGRQRGADHRIVAVLDRAVRRHDERAARFHETAQPAGKRIVSEDRLRGEDDLVAREIRGRTDE